MLLLDLSHTSHTSAHTGIQRVCRALYRELKIAGAARPITYDPYERRWRELRPWEQAALEPRVPSARRGAKWPVQARISGHWRRWTRSSAPIDGAALLVPEVFSPRVAREFAPLFAAVPGPRVAVFHDAIALKYPELTPAKTVARFPGYLRELLAFDGVAAVSEDSANSLREYWAWLGETDTPPVQVIPLGLHPPPSVAPRAPAPAEDPVVLSVGSIEGRKNHLALLDACEVLWARGVRFRLRLVGLSHPQTGRAALERLDSLKQRGRPLVYEGAVSDAALEAAYAECHFTVYPSLMEGFGLPVLESLSRGKPCICSARGALGESARDGGCRTLPQVDASSLSDAIETLLRDTGLHARLVREANHRRYRTWAEYTGELLSWLRALPRRS